MKKYDEYKDSGVAWIGEVPKHWEVGKLKHCSHIVLGKMLMTSPPRGSEGSYTLEKYLKSKNVGWLQLFLEEDNIDEMWFNQYEKSIYKLQENDIVMNEGGDIGKVSCWRGVDFDCYIQNSINKITADYNRVNAGFLCYWLYNLSSLGYFWSIVSQISIAHLTKEKLSNSPVVLPPITEQVAIATYLDTHCAKIDNLISIQQKRIALLQELKQSVITHAVTKGLNPNVEMKQSGVEWIGDVPKHWEVCKLKHYSQVVLGKMLMTSPPKDSEGLYTLEKYLKSKNVGWLQLFLDEDNIDEMWFNQYEKSIYKLQENDIVMNEGGDIGKVSCWRGVDFDCYIQNSINKITADYNRVNAGFLCYWLYNLSSLGYFWSIVSQISIAHLTKEKLSNSPVVLPPITEQAAIASYLDHKCATIDTSISNAQHQIDLLQEYKQSLITEVVTGKRKVTDN